jgi:Asp/Glu/hydantoin racemase
MMGTSFTLVSVNNKFASRVIENVRRYGHEPRMISVEPMRVDHLPKLASGFSGARQDAQAREAIFDAFREAARAGIAKGAEVIIPAGGVVMTMLANAGVYEVDGVPVLDGTTALTKMGETAVKLHRLTGTFTSKRLAYAPPGGNVLREVRAAYGPDIYPGAS